MFWESEVKMAEQSPSRRTWFTVSIGILFVFLGAVFVKDGLAARDKDVVRIRGNKYEGHAMTAGQSVFAGIVFALGGGVWLWSCFRKQK